MRENNQIFALDIGTRSIVGIILEKAEQAFVVKKVVMKEHKQRAMLDGQIHDVTAVAHIIGEVKKELEEEFGPLTKACVAAAGRSLKTEEASATVSIKGRKLEKDDVIHLELMAIQKAEQQIKNKFDDVNAEYFCVGYSVLYYYLDGQKIGNLIDQIGNEASVDIIATFLPRIVIDSLATALKQCNLEIEALTLEPIAAIHVLIPPSMRRLNVALVDIGAGTSDIAITDQSTIVNYGMVPVAGDEITEAISDQFLLDFPMAEEVKIQLTDHDTVTIKDILGFEQTMERKEIIQSISPAIDHLATKITEEIYRLNGLKPPKAVMLIGGGSLTPGLDERVAEKLNLPKNRVAIRGINAIQNLPLEGIEVTGPEMITPIGIAIYAKQNPLQFKTVYVNEMPVRMFEVKKLTVGDCLIQAGVKLSQLYGKPGLAKIITVNGKAVTISGSFGSPPILLKNEHPCSLDDYVDDGDIISAQKGNDGKSVDPVLKDLLQDFRKNITFNGNHYEILPIAKVNGKTVTEDYIIKDRDTIEWHELNTVQDLLNQFNLTPEPFILKINNQEKTVPQKSDKVLKNGKEVQLTIPIADGDVIEFIQADPPTVEELAFLLNWQLDVSIPVTFNGKEILMKKKITVIKRDGIELEKTSRVYNKDSLIVEHNTYNPFIFQDVFRFADFELPANPNGDYLILKNGEQATFIDKLEPGDQLEIKWLATNGKE
mgnify:CR=1 FL=1